MRSPRYCFRLRSACVHSVCICCREIINFPRVLYFLLLAGADYNSTGLHPGKGKSNLIWKRHTSAPIAQFIVPIIDDDIPEPIEVLEIFVECEKNRNCYLPRQRYTITIIDDQGTYVARCNFHTYHLIHCRCVCPHSYI